MAAKRLFDGDEDQPNPKRMKNRPSFASVIRDVVMVNFFENFCSALEPMLRRVVSEEVEKGLRRRCMSSTFHRSPSLRMIEQAPSDHQLTRLMLRFGKTPSLPIFTSSKIVDADGDPLQIILAVDHDDHKVVPTSLPYPVKVEIVVLNGDFPSKDDTWTSEEFARNLVKERTGKRPLLTGDNLNCMTMRDGVAVVGDIEFTDNSSWIRSRRFRLGARVVAGGNGNIAGHGVVIREAITESFMVKDHRGELYKKHHPPALNDEVWRLEKIGKGGAFHQKLASEGIHTVQDFLKLYVVDSPKLRKTLGVGMSEKMWDATLKHAKTCVLGTKFYRAHGNNYTLTLNPICQLIKAEFNGQVYCERELKRMQKAYVESLVKDAYAKWNSLEEVDGQVLETALLTQGEIAGQYPDQQQLAPWSNVTDSSCSVMQNNDHTVEAGDYSDEWALNSTNFYLTTNNSEARTSFRFFSESSSEGDIA